MAIEKWTQNKGKSVADKAIDTDKIVPLARIKVKNFDEPVIVLMWINMSTIQCTTEKSRDMIRITPDQIEAIITEDILA